MTHSKSLGAFIVDLAMLRKATFGHRRAVCVFGPGKWTHLQYFGRICFSHQWNDHAIRGRPYRRTALKARS
jgi:hypothetical protein